MDDISACHVNRDRLTLFIVSRLAEWDVEYAQDIGGHHAGCRYAATRRVGPLLDTEELVVADHRAQQLEATLEDSLHERLALIIDGVMYERKERDKAFWRHFALRAEVGEERCDRVREALTLKQTHDITTTSATSIVLHLLLLDLV